MVVSVLNVLNNININFKPSKIKIIVTSISKLKNNGSFNFIQYMTVFINSIFQ